MGNKINIKLTSETSKNGKNKYSINFTKQVNDKKNILLKTKTKSDFKFWGDMWN